MLKSNLKIDLPEWLVQPSTELLMRAIGGYEAEPLSMFVGGCVRNTLMEKISSDVDIATKLLPEEVIKKCQSQNIKVIPTGIDHGTVTAVIDSTSYEITTLRKDVKTDGRHADVSYTDDWVIDAQRRDFTINTLLMDVKGSVYDPLGTGVAHIENHQVIFVGDPNLRIQEDYLRILRFFRFFACYAQGQPDHAALEASALFADQISTLSRERITSEFLKILETKQAPDVLVLMFENNMLIDLQTKKFDAEILKHLILFQGKLQKKNTIARLLVMSGNKARFFDDYLRLSHAQKNFLIKLDMTSNGGFYEDEKTLKKAIYYHGHELMIQGYLIYCAKENTEPQQDKLDVLEHWQPPECPITGDTLIKEGYVTGPDLGAELKIRQEEWLERVLN